MILLELAAQGIRGVTPSGGRATLRPGYNVVAAEGAALRRLLEALFYPSPRDGDGLPRGAGGPAGAPVRAGLTVVGNDRVTYRLVRDFAAGAQLHRFDAEKRTFALVSQDLAEIGRLMQQSVGVPPRTRLGALLVLSAAELPSKQGTGGAAGLGGPQRTALTPDQVRKRLEALRAELEKGRVAEKLQYELDGLQAKLFKLEEALKGGAKLREGLAQAEDARAEVAAAANAGRDLGDADAKLAAYEKATARIEEARAKVSAEREALDEGESGGRPKPFWVDPLFWVGAGGGLAVAAVALAGAPAVPDLRYLALLGVPAFGWAAWVALRWIRSLERWERIGRRRRIVDDWEKKVEAQYVKDAAAIDDAVKALGLTKASELKEALARAADADTTVADRRRRLAEWEGSADAQGAVAEKKKVEAALHDVESRLSSEVGGFVRDVRSIESDIQRLEAEAAAPAAAPAAPRPVGEPLRTLVERAAAELGGSPTAAVRAVAQKASHALAGLSSQRLQALQVDDRGNLHVQTGGRPVPVMTLSPVDRDLVWLSLKLAFVEHALSAGKLVAVAEDAFGGLPEAARRFAARLLKQIARPGQLVHATTDPSFREAADHAAV